MPERHAKRQQSRRSCVRPIWVVSGWCCLASSVSSASSSSPAGELSAGGGCLLAEGSSRPPFSFIHEYLATTLELPLRPAPSLGDCPRRGAFRAATSFLATPTTAPSWGCRRAPRDGWIAQLRGGGVADDDGDSHSNENSASANRSDLDLGLLATATVLETTTTTLLDAEGAVLSDGAPPRGVQYRRGSRDSAASSDPTAEGESGTPARQEGAVNMEEEGGGEDEEEEEEEGEEDHGEEDSASLRARGKELHDAGDFSAAADVFRKAASLLLPDGEDSATCRLHEALCRLKAGGSDEALRAAKACDDVLQHKDRLPNVLVARAFHRRAKAHVELDQTESALQDARSAAFLGDRKAVALYGKLLRDHPNASGSISGELGGNMFGSGGAPGWSDSSGILDLLMGASGSNTAGLSTASPDAESSSSLSLSMLSSLLSVPGQRGADSGGGGNGGSLAQSVLSSLSKRLHDESTQDTICRVLQQTTPGQLTAWAGIAGLPLAERQAAQLSALCRRVTPAVLKSGLRWTRRLAAAVRVLRLLARLLRKHRTLLILLCLLAWTKSAVLRPLPVSRRQRQLLAAAAQPARAVQEAAAFAVL